MKYVCHVKVSPIEGAHRGGPKSQGPSREFVPRSVEDAAVVEVPILKKAESLKHAGPLACLPPNSSPWNESRSLQGGGVQGWGRMSLFNGASN